MSSSATLRLFFVSSKPALNLNHHLPLKRTPAPAPPLLFLSSPISFQRVSNPSPSSINAQPQALSPDAELDPSTLPPALRQIVALFQSVPDPKAKYHQLLHYGRQLPPLDPAYKTDAHRVRGCVSQVWVRAFPDPETPTAVRFEADSDSALTKGLAALLVLGLSGSPAAHIARVPPDFVRLLGLRQSLTPSRNNGFLNMLRLMQQKALLLHDSKEPPLAAKAADGDVLEQKAVALANTNSAEIDASGLVSEEVLEHKDGGLDMDAVVPLSGRAGRIRERLERELSPVELVIEDISHQHAGHAGVRGIGGGETHFNVRVVSGEFEGKSLVKRHRLVYGLLQEELESGLHALSIDAKSPSEVGTS